MIKLRCIGYIRVQNKLFWKFLWNILSRFSEFVPKKKKKKKQKICKIKSLDFEGKINIFLKVK